MTDRPAIIILANSARAIAASARRAGFSPLAVDVFGDSDTREASLATMTLDGGLSAGLAADKVECAVKTLISDYHPIGLAYGSGFEHQPETIAALAGELRIFGNRAESIRRAKDPLALADFCAGAGILHPPITFDSPEDRQRWLLKTRGGAGGTHVVGAVQGRRSENAYYQRRVKGESISALFVADGQRTAIIGLSRQWTSPTSESPFRYGGAAGPIGVGRAQAAEIARCVARVAAEMRLVGVNSADFVVSGDAVWLIEINPRPGATMDLFEPDRRTLFEVHVAACDGKLLAVRSGLGFRAAMIVYAPADLLVSLPAQLWPQWTADQPRIGTRIVAGDPLCTVLASAVTVDAAQRLVEMRAEDVMALVREMNR